MNLSMFDSRHKWFDRAISILNIKNEEAISIYDALIEFNNRGYKVSKIPSTAKSSLCNVITSSYMSSHNGITMSNRETILHLMQYKEIFLNTSVAYKNNNYFAISVSASYAGSDLINYLIYDIDTAADQLATPLHAVSILEDIDLQTGKKLKDDGEFLTVEFSDAIYLKLDKKSLQIKACFQSYPSLRENTVMGDYIQKFDSLIAKAEDTADTFHKALDRNAIKKVSKKGGFYIEDPECTWLSNLLSFNYHQVSELIDKLLLSRKKDSIIEVCGEIFEIIDVAIIEGDLIVIRTTFREDSSQLVLLFEKEDTAITTILATLIDVFPHEGETSNEYSKNNIVQSSSRSGVQVSSHIQIIENTHHTNDYTVKEDILFKYKYYEIRFPDIITVKDDVVADDTEQREFETQNNENIEYSVNDSVQSTTELNKIELDNSRGSIQNNNSLNTQEEDTNNNSDNQSKFSIAKLHNFKM